MAIVVESTGSASGVTASLDITNFTVGSQTGKILLVCVSYVDGSRPNTVTWDSAGVNQALTNLKRQRESVSSGRAVDIWYLLNPTAATAKTITIANTGSTDTIGGAIFLSGCANASAAAAFRDTTLTGDTADSESGASHPATVTLTSAVGELVAAVAVSGTALTSHTMDTEHWNATTGTIGVGGTKAGAASVTTSWDTAGANTQWAIAAVSVIPSGAGGGGMVMLRRRQLLGVG